MFSVRKAAITSVVAVVGSLAVGVSPAVAAAPANDTRAAATVLSDGDSGSLDTSEAAVDEIEEPYLTDCGAFEPDAAVWFKVTADHAGTYYFDSDGSDFFVNVIAVDPDDVGRCGGSWGTLTLVAGQTGYFLVYDENSSPGNLNYAFTEVFEPIVQVTIDPTASVSRTGTVTLTGTYECQNSELASLSYDLTQRRVHEENSDELNGQCDGTTKTWANAMTPEKGKFAKGTATARVRLLACPPGFDCRSTEVTRSVTLVPPPRT